MGKIDSRGKTAARSVKLLERSPRRLSVAFVGASITEFVLED